MRTRGDINDIACVASHNFGTGWVYFVVPGKPYSLEWKNARASAKI